MSLSDFARKVSTWLRRPAISRVEQDIDDELMFHLSSQIDEHLAEGKTNDDAWQAAQQRFGSLRRYADACRQIARGEPFSLQNATFVALAALTLLVGWLSFEIHELRTRRVAQGEDLVGMIVNDQSAPISGAHVLVVLKTWPGGWFRQDAFATTTDARGRFRLPELLPREGQYAVQVAALGNVYALGSSYLMTEEKAESRANRVTLQLDSAAPITLVVQGADGLPIADARVVPAERRSADGKTHLVYFQGSEPLQIAANAVGEARLDCFERGDEAEIYVQPPGKPWLRRTISIPADGDHVVVSVVEAGGSSSSPLDERG
jgi:hypothetical protein